MNALIRWSIRYRSVVATLAIVWLVLGAVIAWRAPLDVFPEFVPPQVDIQTECPGFAPEQVEQNVTRVIEAAVNGTTGLATLRSDSVFGLSVITLTFEEKADPYIFAKASLSASPTWRASSPPVLGSLRFRPSLQAPWMF